MPSRDEFLERVGRRIRSLRLAKGWSLADLAKRAGYERGYIGEVERGRKNIPILTLRTIAEALDAPLEQTLEGASKGTHTRVQQRPARRIPQHVAALAEELADLSPPKRARVLPAIRSVLRAAGVARRRRR